MDATFCCLYKTKKSFPFGYDVCKTLKKPKCRFFTSSLNVFPKNVFVFWV